MLWMHQPHVGQSQTPTTLCYENIKCINNIGKDSIRKCLFNIQCSLSSQVWWRASWEGEERLMRKKGETKGERRAWDVGSRQLHIDREQIYRLDKTVPYKRSHYPAHKHRKCLMDMQTLSRRPEQKNGRKLFSNGPQSKVAQKQCSN